MMEKISMYHMFRCQGDEILTNMKETVTLDVVSTFRKENKRTRNYTKNPEHANQSTVKISKNT